MVEYDYIEALGGGSFLNMSCTMNQNMEVEFKFMTTDYPDSTYQRQGNFFVLGGNGGDVVLRGEDQHQYWYSGGGDWVVSDWWTLNEEHKATWTKDVWTFDEHSHNTTGGCYTGRQNLSITCIDCGLRIVSVTVRLNGSVVNEFVGAEDNGVVGLYDKANDLFYQPTSGTWSTGSYYVFEPSQNTFSFWFNGGTQTFTVEATNAWTCAAPTDFTISPMSGNPGTTTVTITAPRRISTVSDTVTFTDSQSNTFNISISQSVGTITPNLTIYQGGNTVKKMYYGSGLVYRKMAHSPSLVISGDTFTFPPTSYTAATVVVTTDANWSYSTEASWLSLTKTGHNLEIVPTSDWDQGSEPRTATVTVTADNGFITKSAEISVKQKNTNTVNVDWVTTTYSSRTNTYIDTGIYPTTDTVMKIKYKPNSNIGGALVGYTFDSSYATGVDCTPTGSSNDDTDYRYFYYTSLTTGYFDFNASSIGRSLTYDADGYITVECGNNYLTNVNNSQTTTGTTQVSMATTTVPIYINICSNAWLQSVEIWQGATKVYDGHAAFDGASYGWNDSVSDTFSTQTYGGYALTGAPVPDLTDYLCFTAEQANSTVGMMNYRTDASIDTPVLYYSLDKVMWAQWDYSPITLSNVGDKVYFYGTNNRIGNDDNNYSSFQMSGRISASGDVTTLLTRYGTTQLTHNYCFIHLFDGCTSLTTAPAIPATTLQLSCYKSMFNGCTALTAAPALPATTLAIYCYQRMFQGCTSLTTAPAELPATTLEGVCYESMFKGCTSLTAAPALPATTLKTMCYYSMFQGCTSLASITCLAEDISAFSCTKNWLDGVSASGTFTKSANMNDWTTGVNGIPSGWTVVDA